MADDEANKQQNGKKAEADQGQDEPAAKNDDRILPDFAVAGYLPVLEEAEPVLPQDVAEESDLAQPEAQSDEEPVDGQIDAPWSGVILIGPWHSTIPRPDRISHFSSDLRQMAALKRAEHDLLDSRKKEAAADLMRWDDVDFPVPPIDDPMAKVALESRKDIHPILKYPEEVLVRLVVNGVAHKKPARCRLDQQVVHLLYSIANEIKTPCKLLRLRHRGKTIHDWIRLENLGREENGELLLELELLDPYYVQIPDFQLPDDDFMASRFVDVKVIDACCRQYVEVEPPRYPKRFLGGFRNTRTGVEYHHASIQTRPEPLKTDGPCQKSRDTQTINQRNVYQQTANEMATQMTGVGVYVENITDKVVKPSFKYTTADEYLYRRLRAIIVIQKYLRRHLAKCAVAALRKRKQVLEAMRIQAELEKEAEEERKRLKELDRRVNPKTKYDFDMIACDIEKWRREEVEKIDKELTGSKRKNALCALLDELAGRIECVGKQKLKAAKYNKIKNVEFFLKESAKPKIWKNSDGLSTAVDNPDILRARFLKCLYESLNDRDLSDDERMDTLLTVKNTVKGDKSELTRDLVNLVNREAELIIRGYANKLLDGLRQRISYLFLQYIKTPLYNPACAPLIKVPPKSSGSTKNARFHVCSRCKRFCVVEDFQWDSIFAKLKVCTTCELLENWRNDGSIYDHMLREMRIREDLHNDGARIATLIQSKDINFLVQFIWNNESFLSRNTDLSILTLCRWDVYEQWSPWNCIVLTRDEALIHEQLKDLRKAYTMVFLSEIRMRHFLARKYFRRLDLHEGVMPSVCDSDPAAWHAALAVTKSVGPARLKLARCAKKTWPVIVKENLRRPTNVPPCYQPKPTVEKECY